MNIEIISIDEFVIPERSMTREEALKVLEMFLHKQCDLKRTEFAYDANIVWAAVNMASKALEQEPKIGHWIIKDGKEKGYDIGGVKTWYAQMMCSECGFIKTAIEGHAGQYHYCPNCGARMSESKFYAKLAESYCKGLRDGLTAESEE